MAMHFVFDGLRPTHAPLMTSYRPLWFLLEELDLGARHRPVREAALRREKSDENSDKSDGKSDKMMEKQ